MLATERRMQLVERVRATGFVRITDLQQEFGVSHMTIRRDLKELEHRGLVRRVHGGAATPGDVGFDLRERMNRLDKERVGRRAAELVSSGESVFIDAGTTCLEVARHLVKRRLSPLYLVTTSVKVSVELVGVEGIKLFQLGGEIYDRSYGVAGGSVVAALHELSFAWAFLGSSGFDFELGLTNNNHTEVVVKQEAMRRTARTVFVLDGSKIGQAGLVQISPVGEPHTLVTTAEFSAAQRRRLDSFGWTVLQAGGSS